MSSWPTLDSPANDDSLHRSPSRRHATLPPFDPSRIPLVDLGAQHAAIHREVTGAAIGVLRDADFILGQAVELFEQEFARYCGVSHGVGVDSGTSALELALRAFGVGPGNEVITAANTFIATALAITHTGATPVLVDVDPATHTMDVEQLEDAITDRTRAIVPVHLYGHPADIDPILEVAERRGLRVIEDACQAHGATYRGRRAGSLGHAAAFSFYPSKNLGACGDGGMVVTGDEELARSVRLLRNYGQVEKNRHLICGYNRRLDTIQAAVLRVKLPLLDGWNGRRRIHAEHFRQLLDGSGIMTPRPASHVEPVWHLYVIRVENRDALRAHLAERGIETGIHYPVPIHLQPAYGHLGHGPGSFPVSEHAAQNILSLPMYAELTTEAIGRIADTVREFAAPRGGIVRVV